MIWVSYECDTDHSQGVDTAFFIAGAIGVFVAQGAIPKYFGARTKKWLSYSVASVSGAFIFTGGAL